MEHHDLLLTLAEIAVTLAALSGVAGILGARSAQAQMAAFEMLLLRNVALIGMLVAAFALLPLTVRDPASTGWQGWSALAAGCWLAGYGLFLRRVVAPLRSAEFSAGVFSLGLAVNVTGLALLAWNVAAPSASSAQRYVLALMCALALAVINFVVTVLRPGRTG